MPPKAGKTSLGLRRSQPACHQLVTAIKTASRQMVGRAAAAVNQALVVRNWLMGAHIVQYEQGGADRAQYGDRLLERLAVDLAAQGVRGCSRDMLERMRSLFLTYPQIGTGISAPAARKSSSGSQIAFPGISAPVVRKSRDNLPTPLDAGTLRRLPWSHLIALLRIDDPWKRAFYENECLKGNWSKRQLQRQIESLLYERTGLSKNKQAVIRRAHGQEPHETVEDLIRDPCLPAPRSDTTEWRQRYSNLADSDDPANGAWVILCRAHYVPW